MCIRDRYSPFDNQWLKIGNSGKIKQDDVGVQFKFKRKIKEAYMPEQEIDKNVWVLKATPKVLETIYQGKDMEFHDASGKVIWTNKKDVYKETAAVAIVGWIGLKISRKRMREEQRRKKGQGKRQK